MYSHRTASTTLALMLSLAATVHAQAPLQTVPFDRANLDTTCMACDDFYEFANGGWLQRAKTVRLQQRSAKAWNL